MNEVIICEKPKSAEKIAKALSSKAKKNVFNKKVKYWTLERDGKDITVLSAVGHLYSLTPDNPKDKVYFDLHWAPLFEIDKKYKNYTKDYVRAIKKYAKDADSYIHACDYDIEGTLIGYHALKYGCGEDALKKSSRMKFSTLTKKDIVEAYENRIPIDRHQVDSGVARHILDFYFGVNISKALMKSVSAAKKRFLKLSAGRVQTPTLAMIVQRQKEMDAFLSEDYWELKTLYRETEFSAVIDRLTTQEKAEKGLNYLKEHPFEVVAEGQMKENAHTAYLSSIAWKMLHSPKTYSLTDWKRLIIAEKILQLPKKLVRKIDRILSR